MIPDPNCSCDQCQHARKIGKEETNNPAFIKCDHIPKGTDWEVDGFQFHIGHRRVVSLCRICSGNLSFMILRQFAYDTNPNNHPFAIIR